MCEYFSRQQRSGIIHLVWRCAIILSALLHFPYPIMHHRVKMFKARIEYGYENIAAVAGVIPRMFRENIARFGK